LGFLVPLVKLQKGVAIHGGLPRDLKYNLRVYVLKNQPSEAGFSEFGLW